jgi:DNA replicative helicase MCM subunit Mcm2 (Cdc46/Mcm family)
MLFQEQVAKLSIGTMPRSMLATLEDDLVDACKPGDDVIIWLVVLSMSYVSWAYVIIYLGIS